ncbi:MAG TPA: hypothetical protein VI136_17845 [Verrucomicrobiae bacterium]
MEPTEQDRHRKDCEHGVRHFERVLRLALNLASCGVAIHKHNYDPHFNSAWELVAGTHTHALKFFWDARDQFFTMRQAELKDSGYGTVKMPYDHEWQLVGEESVDVRGGADEMEFLERYLRAKYVAS